MLYLHAQFLLLMPFLYMTLYTEDKRTCVADFSARLYSVSAYYAAKQVAVLPFIAANIVVTDLIMTGMIGLRADGAALGTMIAISLVFYLVAQQVLSLAAIVTPNQEAAFSVAIVWTAVCLQLSNYVIRYADMQMQWLSQLRWVSSMNYSFAAFMRNQFGGVAASCASGMPDELVGTIQRLMPNTRLLRTPAVRNMLVSPGPDCVLNLDAVLDYFGVNSSPLWVYVLALVAYLAVVHVLSYLALRQLARKERR